MKLFDYFKPVNEKIIAKSKLLSENSFGKKASIYYIKDKNIPNINSFDIAILGIPESRASNNDACSKAPDIIREKLYELFIPDVNLKIIDLGNLIISKTLNDTYFAIRDVLAELINSNTIPIIIGGSEDLNYGLYLALENISNGVNITNVNSRINYTSDKNRLENYHFLNKILNKKDNNVNNYTNIGYQQYFNNIDDVNTLNKLFFNTIRLGDAKKNIIEIEPYIRDSNIFSINVASIKQSDAPANIHPSSNGFYGDEICLLSRFAGFSNNVKVFSIFDINPNLDINFSTSSLAAQAIWYFIEGFYKRDNDTPNNNNSKFLKFTVSIENCQHSLIFYKNKINDKWWLKVPNNNSTKKSVIIACTHNDYNKACSNEIPDRWWKTHQKINN